MSNADFARSVGANERSVRRYINGERVPSLHLLQNWERARGLPEGELVNLHPCGVAKQAEDGVQAGDQQLQPGGQKSKLAQAQARPEVTQLREEIRADSASPPGRRRRLTARALATIAVLTFGALLVEPLKQEERPPIRAVTLTGGLSAEWKEPVAGAGAIRVMPDGGVDMSMSGGERRLLASSTDDVDIVVGVAATITGGTHGYGLFFRTSLDASNQLSGYTFQMDQGASHFEVHQWFNSVGGGDAVERTIARSPVPGNFDWYAPHEVIVTLRGNGMSASVDGTEVLNEADLVESAREAGCDFPTPSGTDIGLRAWEDTKVRFGTLRYARV